DVSAQNDLEAAPAGNAVDRRDDRLVEIARVVQSPEPAHAPVLVRLLAARRGLEIPAGGEEFLAGAGDDGDAQRLVVAELDEYVVQAATGREVDGVGLGPVDRDLEYAAVGDGLDSIGHGGPLFLAGLSETNQCIDGHRTFSRGPYDHRIDVDFLKRRELRGCVAGDAGHDLDERIDIAARLAAKTVE